MVTLYKNKGDRSDCNNYRGMVLSSIVRKVYAGVVLAHLHQQAERSCLESQCVFRAERLTEDMIFSLCRILGISRRDKVSNTEVLDRASLPTMYTLLRQGRMSWIGHVRRIKDGRIPNDTLYGEVAVGQRPLGRPQLRYKAVCK